MAGLLDPREGDGTWVENRPSKWQQTWDIFSPYITAPAYAVKGLMDTPLEVLLGAPGTEAAQDEAVANAFNVAGAVTGGSSVVPKPANALNMGIRAYHGSPHSFDKFSMDKIGTGEGAQAYGHGLYFAENEDIARSYRDALAPKRVAVDGKIVETPVIAAARKYSPDADSYIKALTIKRDRLLKDRAENTEDPELGGLMSDLYDVEIKQTEKALSELEPFKGKWWETKPDGSMYEVNIDADPNAFLDWDKPLSEQPEAVQGFANSLKEKSFLARKRLEDTSAATGKDVWEKARNAFGVGNADAATKELAKAGIPGIKYLDAGSRYTPANLPNNPIANEARQFLDAAQGDGEKALQLFRDSNPVDRWAGSERDEITKVIKSAAKPVTRNYVVFDDKLIEILRKYGIAGLLGGGAAMSAMGQPQEQY